MRVYIDKFNIEATVTVDSAEEIASVIKGFELLGKKVDSIKLKRVVSIDFDTPYYKRYSEELINSMYKRLSYGDVEIQYKNKRLYYNMAENEIVLPKEISSSYAKQEIVLTFNISNADE